MIHSKARNTPSVLFMAIGLLICVATVAAVSACRRENAPGTHATSGSRLKQRFYKAPSGAGLLVEFYDVELETPCELARAADGSFRCLPVRPYIERDSPEAAVALPGSMYFADSTCEVVVRGFDGSCDPPSYYRSSTIVGCDHRYTVFRVGDEVEQEDLYVIDGSSGVCVPISNSLSGERRYYIVQEEVNPIAFVELEREGIFGSRRLGRQVYAGSDGSRMHGEVLDRGLNVECRVWWTLDETPRCVPFRTPRMGYYSSSNCDTFLATHPLGAECVDDYVFSHESRDGFPFAVIYELGTQVEPEEVYASMGGDCYETTPPPGTTFWEVGPVISQDTFVALNEHRGMVAGRIQTFGLITPDGFELPRVELWDSEREERCKPQMTSDRVVRCVPYLHHIRDAFRDDACTQPAPVAPIISSMLRTEGESLYGGRFEETCPKTVKIFQLTETAASTPLYDVIAGDCREIQIVAPMGVEGFVEVGDAVPADEFEILELFTE